MNGFVEMYIYLGVYFTVTLSLSAVVNIFAYDNTRVSFGIFQMIYLSIQNLFNLQFVSYYCAFFYCTEFVINFI